MKIALMLIPVSMMAFVICHQKPPAVGMPEVMDNSNEIGEEGYAGDQLNLMMRLDNEWNLQSTASMHKPITAVTRSGSEVKLQACGNYLLDLVCGLCSGMSDVERRSKSYFPDTYVIIISWVPIVFFSVYRKIY
jgi:hypothetical protein